MKAIAGLLIAVSIASAVPAVSETHAECWWARSINVRGNWNAAHCYRSSAWLFFFIRNVPEHKQMLSARKRQSTHMRATVAAS